LLRVDSIKAAADGLVAAALLGEHWEEALARLAQAAGARDAVLMRNSALRTIVAIPTEECADAVADYIAGRAPPNSRHARVKLSPRMGFRFDHDDYTDDDLARDPYYQEFLRSNGVFWHANAVLTSDPGEHVELSLKRRAEAGPYQRADAEPLNAVLPELRAAALLGRAALDAEVRGMKSILADRSHPVFELSSRGRVLPSDAAHDIDAAHPVRVAGGRLLAVDPSEQAALDRAVAAALASAARPAVASLTASNGRRYFLQVVPLPGGAARRIFRSAAALAILIGGDRLLPGCRLDTSIVRDTFGFTDREADVAALLVEGLDLPTICQELRIGQGTVRTHLKRVFEKTGTRRQAEFVALVSRFQL
jgi:DNA-binding CsgD family transcriptional regulator